MLDVNAWKDARVFVTGHTGFKGAWLTKILTDVGARVTGYALEPPTSPALFHMVDYGGLTSVTGDVRDMDAMWAAFEAAEPQFVIHMAAQPIVRDSYKEPAYTYGVNVMGTVNVLECVRRYGKVKSFLNVTTDKVYKNNEWEWGYREVDELDGYDPYSNSKSCSEMVTASYRRSFFSDGGVAISTARAGNVIGGGDFATDRIVPDCVRAIEGSRDVVLRNPHSIRPFQHVLEPLFAYIDILLGQSRNPSLAGSYNVGPEDKDCVSAGEVIALFAERWPSLGFRVEGDGGPHEANFLKLDCSKMKRVFGWSPVWNIRDAMDNTVEWYRTYVEGGDVTECMERQIARYLAERGKEGTPHE